MKKGQFTDYIIWILIVLFGAPLLFGLLAPLNEVHKTQAFNLTDDDLDASQEFVDTFRLGWINLDGVIVVAIFGIMVANILLTQILDVDIKFFIIGIANIVLSIWFATHASRIFDELAQNGFVVEAAFYPKLGFVMANAPRIALVYAIVYSLSFFLHTRSSSG